MNSSDQPVILVLAQTGTLGGANRSLSIVLRQLKAGGARLIVLIASGPAANDLRRLGVDIREWSPPMWTWIGKPLYATYLPETSLDRLAYYASDMLLLPVRLWKAARLLAQLFQTERPSFVYINSLTLFPIAWILAKLRTQYNFQVIWHIREPLNRKLGSIIYSRIARLVSSVSNQIIAISSKEAEAFEVLRPVHILHNSVDLDWVSAAIPEIVDSPVRIAMASAYRPSKGVNDFVEMAGIANQSFPQVKFVLYSPHPIPPRFKKSFMLVRRMIGMVSEKLGLALEIAENLSGGTLNQCVDLEFDRSVTLDMYRAMRIYVRCDRSGSPWGRDVIEAMWAGIPVIATGQSEEFVLNGISGFLVPPGRPDLLAEKVIHLLKDDALYYSMSRAAHERARQLFDPVRYGKRLLDIFGLEIS